MTPVEHDDAAFARSAEPAFSEVDDWIFKFAIVLGVVVFVYIVILGALTFPWILIRFGWTNP